MTRPWLDPTLTAQGRLPMHSVPHADRLELDGRWRFQLLPHPEAEAAEEWAEIDVPGVWTMQGFADLPHYTNVQMPFAGLPPAIPAANPTGLYERGFQLPEGWSGKRIVLHVGAAESVLIVRLNGRDIGISKDSHLAAELDITDVVQAGDNSLSLRVVKWSDATYIEDQDQWWHGGITRSVFVYATAVVHLADVRVNAGLADDLATGTLELQTQVEFGPQGPQPGWVIEARLQGPAGFDQTWRSDVRCPDRMGLARWSRDDQRIMYRHASGMDTGADDAAVWDELHAAMVPPPDGSSSSRIEVARSPVGRPRRRRCTR